MTTPTVVVELEAEDCYHVHRAAGPMTFYCMPAGYVLPAGMPDPGELLGRVVSVRIAERTVSARVASVERFCIPTGTAAHPYRLAFAVGVNRHDPDCRSCDVAAENWMVLS